VSSALAQRIGADDTGYELIADAACVEKRPVKPPGSDKFKPEVWIPSAHLVSAGARTHGDRMYRIVVPGQRPEHLYRVPAQSRKHAAGHNADVSVAPLDNAAERPRSIDKWEKLLTLRWSPTHERLVGAASSSQIASRGLIRRRDEQERLDRNGGRKLAPVDVLKNVAASPLARDGRGRVFLGSDEGKGELVDLLVDGGWLIRKGTGRRRDLRRQHLERNVQVISLYLLGVRIEEIATRYEVRPDTVRKLLARAIPWRNMLRRTLVAELLRLGLSVAAVAAVTGYSPSAIKGLKARVATVPSLEDIPKFIEPKGGDAFAIAFSVVASDLQARGLSVVDSWLGVQLRQISDSLNKEGEHFFYARRFNE
jgi:hypothetical protein